MNIMVIQYWILVVPCTHMFYAPPKRNPDLVLESFHELESRMGGVLNIRI